MRVARTSGKHAFLVDTRWFLAWISWPRIERRDVWFGLFHDRVYIGSPGYQWGRAFYICLIPCLVWHFDIWRREARGG